MLREPEESPAPAPVGFSCRFCFVSKDTRTRLVTKQMMQSQDKTLELTDQAFLRC